MTKLISLGLAVLLLSFSNIAVQAAPTDISKRATTCTVASSNGGDDTPNIVSAFTSCNNGGIVKFPSGSTYNMKSVVSVTGLKSVTVDFQSTVNLPAYSTSFEDAKAYFYLQGDSIHFSGPGVFNGNGQAWYNAKNNNAPPLFKPKATNSYFGGFTINQAPRSHFSVNGCQNVVFESIKIKTVSSDSSYPAKNTDAFDVSSSSDIVIQSSTIVNGDDCIAVNGGVKNLTVTHLDCTGSHGFSIGSLGKKGDAAIETVSDVKFISNACHNCQNGVRIKTWPGGKGSVSGITYQDINLDNVENPIIVTTHYCDNNQLEYCTGEDTHSLTISDVDISVVYGTVSTKSNPVISVNCSTETPCSDFTLTNINVTKNSKTKPNVCVNLTGSDKISYCSS